MNSFSLHFKRNRLFIKLLRFSIAFIFLLNLENIPTSQAFLTWLRPPVSTRIHDEITEVLLRPNIGVSQAAFDRIVWNMAQQDHEDKPMFLDALNHFDDNKLKSSARKLNERLNEAVTIAGGINIEDFYHKLGEILHAAQDFYSHSNYVEMALEDADSGQAPPITGLGQIPVIGWDSTAFGWALKGRHFRSSYLHSGYYYWGGSETNNEVTESIQTCNDALTPVHFPNEPGAMMTPQKYCDFLDCKAEWIGDPEIFKNDQYQHAMRFALYKDRAVLHYYLNKDSDGSPMGSVVHPGSQKTFYELAHDLAERETVRIWEKLEAAIMSRYPNGNEIIHNLKNATPPVGGRGGHKSSSKRQQRK